MTQTLHVHINKIKIKKKSPGKKQREGNREVESGEVFGEVLRDSHGSGLKVWELGVKEVALLCFIQCPSNGENRTDWAKLWGNLAIFSLSQNQGT
jgi:hypothetical protein